MITVKVNDNQKTFSAPLSLQGLIAAMNIHTSGVAIAINHNVIAREKWESELIKNNDEVLIIKSTQGG